MVFAKPVMPFGVYMRACVCVYVRLCVFVDVPFKKPKNKPLKLAKLVVLVLPVNKQVYI